MEKIAVNNVKKEDLGRLLDCISKHNFKYRTFEELGVKDEEQIRILLEGEEGEDNIIVTWERMDVKVQEGFEEHDIYEVIGKKTQLQLKVGDVAVIQNETNFLITLLNIGQMNKDQANVAVRNGYRIEVGPKVIEVLS